MDGTKVNEKAPGVIDVEVADRVPLERLLAPCLAFDRWKPADLVVLEQAVCLHSEGNSILLHQRKPK